MKLYTIDTGFFKLDGGAMFGVVPKSMWSKLNAPDENNLCTWAMQCLLIEDENRLILIDTGIGKKQSEKFLSHYYLHGNDTLQSSLQKHGFNKHDVTDVILTHLHFDHVGGAIERVGDKLQPVFPNAIYWSNQQHWQWAIKPNAREKASFLPENILPLQQSGRLQFIQTPKPSDNKSEGLSAPELLALIGTQFSKNIFILFASGHTKNMMLPLINYNGNTILYMADLVPSAAHIPLPYVMAYDMFPLITLEEKERYLNIAALNNYTLFFEHDPSIECCTLQQTDKGIRVKETFALAQLIS